MEILVIIISILALALSLFTYFKHDHKIKQQETRLNNYQIEKIEIEKENEKKADIEAFVINGSNRNKIIKVYNKGKCIAQNVEVTFPDETEGYTVLNNPCPIEIRPQQSIEILLGGFTLNSKAKELIHFKWSDDNKTFNESSQTIQIF